MSIFAYTLELKNDAEAIRLYEAYHAHPFPEIAENWRNIGCRWSKIFRHGLRLIILTDFDDDSTRGTPSSPELAARLQQWDQLMKSVQVELHDSHRQNPEKMGKWTRMDEIYTFPAA